MKELTIILKNAKSIYNAFSEGMKSLDKEFDSIADNPRYSKVAIQEARQTRQEKVRSLASKQKRLLAEMRAEAHEAVKNDRSHLDYRHLNNGLVQFLTLAGNRLSENDYRLLAVDNANDMTALSMIGAAAERNGYTLDIGNTPQRQLEMIDSTFDRLDKTFDNAMTIDSWDDAFIGISFQNSKQALEPTQPENFRCYRNDLESAIVSEIQSERNRNAVDDKGMFEAGFTGAKPNTNYADSLQAVSDVLRDFNNPQKSSRVLSSIVRAVKPEKLTGEDRLDSDSVKLISDFYQRSGDTKTADELREIASLMRHDNLVYGTAQGTFAQLDTEGLHERHAQMVQKAAAHSQRLAEQAARTAAVKTETEQAAEYGM